MAGTDREKSCLNKLTWHNLEQARAAMAYAGWQYGDSNTKVRAYKCKFCNKWHLARDNRD